MIGCSFVVDREYFGDIGLLDPGMEVYGGDQTYICLIRNVLKTFWLSVLFPICVKFSRTFSIIP